MIDSDLWADTCRRAQRLRELHVAPQLLILVNVWDAASAAAVARVPNCTAVATASASIAASYGYPDGQQIPVELMLAAVGRIVAAVGLPVTADLESGYGNVDRTVRRAVQLGVAGVNIEDGMRPVAQAVGLVEQAVSAAAAEAVPLVVNARTDCYLSDTDEPGTVRLAQALERGTAFLDAGADCVFVPGCTEPAEITALVDRFGAGRLSLLAVAGLPDLESVQAMGVARVSFGPAPHRHALTAFTDLATTLLDD